LIDVRVVRKDPYSLIEIAPYDDSVDVVFLGGADFDPRRHSEPPTGPATSR